MTDPYDSVPYTEHAYAESHPDRLRVVAALCGFAGPTTLTPRVLELGCGRGGNLLPLAASWPEATFVGVDRSAVQIKDAVRVQQAAELTNVQFLTGDFSEPSIRPGAFDYVLCHGVFSWIPPASRAALLKSIAEALTEHGIAYVSWNALPGWYEKLAARDWMRHAAQASFTEGPKDALRWLRDAVSHEQPSYRRQLEEVWRRLGETDAAYLTHEYLAEEHHPIHVKTFLAEVDPAGLTYLGDALPRESAFQLLPPAVGERARVLPLGEALTIADFTRNTAFRRSLLVRSDTARRADFRAPWTLDPQALLGARMASRLVPRTANGTAGPETFEGRGTTLTLDGPPARALRALASVAPRGLACVDLARAIRAPEGLVARELFDVWLACPDVDLHYREPDFVTIVSELPRACGVARWHATLGSPVTNVWLEEVALPDLAVRFVLSCLDGRTTHAELARRLCAQGRGQVSETEALLVVRASLDVLAKAALLVG